MSLNQRDMINIRSLPYPINEEQLVPAMVLFTKFFYEQRPDRMDKIIKSLRKGIDAGMNLPIYIHTMNEEEQKLCDEMLDMFVNAERKEEKNKYLDEVSEEELARVRLLLFLDRLYSKMK